MVNIYNLGNNKIDIDSDFVSQCAGTITVIGDDNDILIGPGCTSSPEMNITCGPRSTVHIGHGVRLAASQIFLCPNAKLIIGHYSAFVHKCQIMMHEPQPISFGHNCLISDDVSIWVSDAHSIIDRETGARLNHARPIQIGHRVWIGAQVRLLKGSSIGEESIIGANSLVTGIIPANSLAFGIPARVHRSNVFWDINILQSNPISSNDSQYASAISGGASTKIGVKSAQDIADEAGYRVAALRIVLDAALASKRWFGFDRRRFRKLIMAASRAVPSNGSAAIQHDVLLTESRRVLNIHVSEKSEEYN